MARARVLADAVDLLGRLIRIPGELRDVHVGAFASSTGRRAEILVALHRHVDARVRVALVVSDDRRVGGTSRAPVVERDGDRAGGPGRDRRLELVSRCGIRVVVDDLRSAPAQSAVRGLDEVHVHVSAGRVVVLVREVDVTQPPRAGREVLDDPVAELRRREKAVRVLDRACREREGRPSDAVVL